MNRTPMKHRGKVTARRERGMKDSAPVVCARAGGSWCGWSGERCVGAQCEDCGRAGAPEYTHQWGGKRYCVECRPECCSECGFPMPEDHEKHGMSGDLCSEQCAREQLAEEAGG